MATKYIFVTGGVVSSLGKGIAAASLGRLLKDRGFNVIIQKFDPYINVDPGKMSPYQHGEVFVTDDGAETDLDLGHYERFIDINLTKNNSITSGKIYWSVLNNEREGKYNGGTVQVIPHITNEIKERIMKSARERDVDIVITEIGGTTGDIESLPFIEAIRQIKHDIGKENILYIHVTLVPYLSKAGELKTKPTQNSVKELRGLGIQPDILICRTEKPLDDEIKAKIALFCDLDPSEVIENMDADTIYEIPQMFENEGLPKLVIDHLGLECKDADFQEWNDLVKKVRSLKDTVEIALVGKYVELKDAYISVSEALRHGGFSNDVEVKIRWIHAEDINDSNCQDILKGVSGILVPGGFGDRGVNGKISAIKYARENNIPFLGICLGMQLAVVDFARNVLGLTNAHSTEFNLETEHPVVSRGSQPGLRLGAYPCNLQEGSLAREIYKDETIYERHRHKFEINNDYKDALAEKGLIASGLSPDKNLVEIVELKDHPWFIGVQFHPEFKSRPTRSHPLFKSFIGAAYKNGAK